MDNRLGSKQVFAAEAKYDGQSRQEAKIGGLVYTFGCTSWVNAFTDYYFSNCQTRKNMHEKCKALSISFMVKQILLQQKNIDRICIFPTL